MAGSIPEFWVMVAGLPYSATCRKGPSAPGLNKRIKTPHINSRGSYRFSTLRAINWHLWLNNGELRVMTESKAEGCVPRYGVFFNRFIEQDIPDVGPLTRG